MGTNIPGSNCTSSQTIGGARAELIADGDSADRPGDSSAYGVNRCTTEDGVEASLHDLALSRIDCHVCRPDVEAEEHSKEEAEASN